MKFAVIDIGSLSVRSLLWEDGRARSRTGEDTALSEGLALSGNLSRSAMERTAEAVARFARLARQAGAEKTYAFATEAVRSAKNGADFVMLVKNACGLDTHVLTGEEEAAAGLCGALGQADGGIVDVGGASTEITVRSRGSVVYSRSLPLGAVRLYDLCGEDEEGAVRCAAEYAARLGRVPAAAFSAVGGTATGLASAALGQKTYSDEGVDGYFLSAKELRSVRDRLSEMGEEGRRREYGMSARRAKVICCGATLLLEFEKYLGIDGFTLSVAGNTDGYARMVEAGEVRR